MLGEGDGKLAVKSTAGDLRSVVAPRAVRRIPGHKTWVWLMTALLGAAYSVASVVWYNTYLYGTYDLGIFDQAVRSYASFQPGISVAKGMQDFGNPNFAVLGDHFSPIDASLAPLYWLYDSPVDLLIAQAVLFALAIPPIWAFTSRAFGGGRRGAVAAYCVSTAYALSWTIAEALRVGFHEVAFVPVLTAVALERLQAGRLKPALLALAGLLLVKEDMGLYVAGLGLGLAATRELGIPRQRLTGLAIGAAGVVATYLAIYVVTPAMGGRSNYYWAYGALGDNVPQALGHVIAHPASSATLLITPWVKAHTMLQLAAPFLFLSLLSPITWAAIPLLLERMLSNTTSNWWQSAFQYNAYLVVPLALGAVDGVLRIERWVQWAWRTSQGPQLRPPVKWAADKLPVAVMAAFALLAVGTFPSHPLDKLLKSSFYRSDGSARAQAAVASHVPSGVTIETTGGGLGPHLDSRDTVEVWAGPDSHSPVFPPWVVVNAKSLQFGWDDVQQQAQRVALLRAHGYVTVFSAGGYALMRAPDARTPGG